MSVLKLTHFGNPILRKKARTLLVSDIKSAKIQQLIKDIRSTNEIKKYGVGLAAPQVGESVALSVIGIKPTPSRPDLEIYNQVIINPSYRGIGRRTGMWEGCQSSGSGRNILYGKALRYKAIQAKWTDEDGIHHNQELTGFIAHVFQHETDHLNGILFVDKVRDTKTFMLLKEYRKYVLKK